MPCPCLARSQSAFRPALADARVCRRRACSLRGGALRAAKADVSNSPAAVRALVSAVTELLRLSGHRQVEAPRRLDGAQSLEALLALLREDFEKHAYFATGNICEGLYQEDCFFGDPTVSFTGLQRWRSNLQLLVPFLEQPRIELLSLASDSPTRTVQAEWRLVTNLRLPWRPLIDILGATEYMLDASCTKIERHIESWSISGVEALAMILRPAPRQSA